MILLLTRLLAPFKIKRLSMVQNGENFRSQHQCPDSTDSNLTFSKILRQIFKMMRSFNRLRSSCKKHQFEIRFKSTNYTYQYVNIAFMVNGENVYPWQDYTYTSPSYYSSFIKAGFHTRTRSSIIKR